MELQSRYGNDDRFKLDEKFIDSEEEDMEEGMFRNHVCYIIWTGCCL